MSEAKTVKAKPKPRQRKANGYKFPEKLPVGEVLKDVAKKEWSLGPSIGKGGFGEIYCAREVLSSSRTSFPFVIKIEPHENGPLFVEKHFYLKVAKSDDVESWKQAEGIKILGIPSFHGFGSHDFKEQKYRFLVIERYGKDVWSIFLENNKQFPYEVVYRCAIQIIDVLQYIHSKGYIHGDIKGANLLLGLKKGTENNVFLVDFGLSCKYSVKEFKRDPKRAHNGTIEYTSRDWHLGVPTRRGDMEILGYNLLHWVSSSLPWEGVSTNPEKVHEKKDALMSQVKSYLKTNFPNVPSVIAQYLDHISRLRHDEAPNYNLYRNLFKVELEKLSCSMNGKLDFTSDQNLTTQSLRRKKKETATQARKKQKVVKGSDCDLSDVEMVDDFEENVLNGLEEAKPKKTSRPRKAVVPPINKISWKDAPTIKTGNIGKAGEYQRKTSPRKAKKKI